MHIKIHKPVKNQVTCENNSHLNLKPILAIKPKKIPDIRGLLRKCKVDFNNFYDKIFSKKYLFGELHLALPRQ
tara:strand:- start:14512 stop:14730 length:219 start_codon:yes stop_codon:yes gene_type:complete